MPEERRYVGCTVKLLPPHQRAEAARTAVSLNPANKPLLSRALAGLAVLSPDHLALLTSKYWGPKGVDLDVYFMDNPDQETRRKILAAANRWNKSANVQFRETASSNARVRLARTPGQGYYSYLGTDVLHVPPSECTMNLDSFTANTPDSEYLRVPPHEFGHTSGFPHEHERPEIIRRLKRDDTIALFMRTQGWSREEVIQQLLTPPPDLDPRSPAADVRSIMCYELPASITVDGQPIPGGMDIDDEDYAFAALLYPKGTGGNGGGTPPPNPPPSGRVLALSFSRPVPRGGTVRFRSPVEFGPGQFELFAAGQAHGQAHEEVLADAGL